MLPCSLLRRIEGFDEFYEPIKLANQSMGLQLPTPERMGRKNVKRYYESMHTRVKEFISSSLEDTFGTLIFDGLLDRKGVSVVNILLSPTGSQKVRKIFFLRSMYTGSRRVDAGLYARLCEESMLEFEKMMPICATVSDNNFSCIKAKEILLERHLHMLSVQEQPHTANWVMQDIGQLLWIKEVLSMVTAVIADLTNHPKLYSNFKELTTEYNFPNSGRSAFQLDRYR
ncbi:hypothetical protein BWQ96_05872 [Gracilariopsis chorda]|uniref:DUF659 domain-containing protein n=1 Tax=Gracilariopsis chorda TaxID=448386 RepID=A0A2V3IQR1_9FLOR|nr:hypothetical protein BWQ96_05872 [Gracilariopsis chorda]|eukprot:PXF44429.1 hypothetical protein BWQ96_05872 [Gracilariopsis chorda]